MQFQQFRIATRGLIIQNNKLLFVSNDGHYWYLPGGRLEPDEGMEQCLEREVYEETGFIVKAGPLVNVLECFDIKDYIHKILFFFRTDIVQANETLEWTDTGGSVRYRRFFSLAEIQEQKEILPRFLAKGEWCKKNIEADVSNIYQGIVNTKGFEVLES